MYKCCIEASGDMMLLLLDLVMQELKFVICLCKQGEDREKLPPPLELGV